jgi:nucleoside-diphosphate-sugar epimerase
MRAILVAGATGHQGTAAVKSLLATNGASTSPSAFKIVAITRDPSSESARSLQSLDPIRVELVRCNLNDEKATRAVFESYKEKEDAIYGVFCVLAFPGLGKSALGEERQGKVSILCII